MKILSEERAKEVAKTMAIVLENKVKNSVLQNLDLAYSLANEFVDKYGLDDTQWIEKCWESTICEFIKDRI